MPLISKEILSNCVVNLRQDNEVGTGILVVKDDRGFLVTATHVAAAMKPNCSFIIRGAGDVPIALTIDSLVDNLAGNPIPWVNHPIADVSVLEISQNRMGDAHFQSRFLPSDCIHQDKTPIDRDTELTTIGFPRGLGVVGHFSPLTFRTHAASGFITLNRADTKKPCDFFILESPGMGGYSGGPVFDVSIYVHGGMTSTGGGTMMYGIVHGTLSDQTGGKLAAITPSHFIFDLI